MTPRPRTRTNTEIFDALRRVVGRAGPQGVTVSEIADEAGLSGPALIRRFGSKRALINAFLREETARSEEFFCSVMGTDQSPLNRLEALLRELGRRIRDPRALAHYLAFLSAEAAEGESRRAAALKSWTSCLEQFRDLFQAALTKGELAHGDPERLALTARTVMDGALVGWAVAREGTLEDWLVARMDEVIEPYRTNDHHDEGS